MKNNKNNIIVFLSFIILTIGSLLVYILVDKKNNNVSNLVYKIVYYDDIEPGSKYDIKVYNDRILYSRTHFSSVTGDKAKIDDYVNLKYSQAHVDEFIKFINNNFKIVDTIELNKNKLNEYQKDVMVSLTLSEYYFEIAIEGYKYSLEYSYSDDLFYNIYIKENGSILVKKCILNESNDITDISTFNVKFKKQNMKIVNDYIMSCFLNNDSKKEYKSSLLRKDEINVMNSIINNDETYLKNSNVKLLYTISFEGINCLTPTIYLYDDNSYEYYYTFIIGNGKNIPKTGIYNFNVDLITKDAIQDDKYSNGYYIVHNNQSDKKYIISASNNKLVELLNSINVSLDKCLESQN